MTERFKIKDIRDEVFNVVINEVRKDENGKWYVLGGYDDIDYMCKKENQELVKEKVNHLVDILNSSTEEEVENIFNSDFQEEIYPTL